METSGYDKRPEDIVRDILKVLEELNHLKDVETILDKVLYEARRMTGADAGSIFLLEGDDKLSFSYVHNDTLFEEHGVNKAVYDSFTVPINEDSIVGYSFMCGEILNIPDAYQLDPALPYSFNQSFDEETGYHTQSILTIPLLTLREEKVGVMQLLNAKTESGAIRAFGDDDMRYAPLFANHASVAIERGIMTRELILRMMKMAEMRDPSETGAHVQRVGSYSAEIYHHIALKQGMDHLERKRTKDLVRLAAMLHDVGKVGIPDAILKKPGRLTDEEFEAMRWHTVFGAALFARSTSELDEMCRDIALCHHERYDGRGYPGLLHGDLSEVRELNTNPRKSSEVPLPARICALADVYDALTSQRCYKDAWPEEKALNLLREESGKQFDPDVVDAFMDIYDVILAIKGKYSEQH